MKWIRKLFRVPPDVALDRIRQMRAEADAALNNIEAALDGEEQWFLEHYDDKQPPSCGLRQPDGKK